jgi:hypothetical protein
MDQRKQPDLGAVQRQHRHNRAQREQGAARRQWFEVLEPLKRCFGAQRPVQPEQSEPVHKHTNQYHQRSDDKLDDELRHPPA